MREIVTFESNVVYFHSGKPGLGGQAVYAEPVDELDYSNLSLLDHSNSSDDSLSEDQFSHFRHRPFDLSTANRSSSRIESFLAGADDSRYFGIEPVKINVNRRAEINISGGEQRAPGQFDSPRFIKVVEMNSNSSVENRSRLTDVEIKSKVIMTYPRLESKCTFHFYLWAT